MTTTTHCDRKNISDRPKLSQQALVWLHRFYVTVYIIPVIVIYLLSNQKNSQAVKKGAAPKNAMVKKDVKSKVAAKKWL